MNPVQKKRMIRTIVASRTNGFDVERDELAKRVLPKLRHYSMATHGIEFQMLEFAGPSPGENEEDRSQYLEQLYHCYEMSIGPAIIAFIDADEESASSPRDSGFRQVIDQAYFNYSPSKRNQKCLFIVRRSVSPKTMHKPKAPDWENMAIKELQALPSSIEKLATKNNILKFVLHSHEGEPLEQTQSHYLESFCESVYDKMVELIDENVIEFTNSHVEASLKPEMTQHWDYAQTIWSNFSRDRVEDEIKSYLESDSDQMLVVHGLCEQDLSSVMARSAISIRDWSTNHGHHTKTSVVLRHIGLAPQSRVKSALMRSVSTQLRPSLEEDFKTSDEIEQLFRQIIQEGEHQGSLVMFLDLVNILDDVNWLPKRLASNVKLVVSVVTNSRAMTVIKRKCYDNDQYINVPELALSEQCSSIDMLHRHRYHQKLSQDHLQQFRQVLSGSDKSGYYTSMLVRFAEKQRIPLITAFTTIRNVEVCLENQICCLSMNHPKSCLQRALAYLAAAPNGLSVLEMEDLLSLDNDVMTEIPGTCTNRIPSKVISLLLKDLEPLLTQLQLHGIEVHQFCDSVVHGYMLREFVHNPGIEIQIHSNMADYFLGVWHDRAKSFCDIKHTTRLVQVPDQGLVYNSATKFPVYNNRKLTLMPYHLAKADRTAELKCQVLYNLDWIRNKIRALGVHELIQDYALSSFSESKIIATTLKQSESTLIFDESVLIVELSGRLLPYYNEYAEIKFLVDQCDEFALHNGGLIPRLPLFIPPDTVLERSEQLPRGAKYEHFMFKNVNTHVISIRKAIGHVVIQDVEMKETVCDWTIHDIERLYLTPDGKYVIFFTKRRQIQLYSTDTGDLCMELPYTGDSVFQTSITSHYVAFTMEKSAGPYILDLTQGVFIHRLNLHCKVVSMSRCGGYLICDGENRLNIYKLPLVQRLCTLDIKDTKAITFAPKQGPTPKGPDFYVVTKPGNLLHVTIDLVCNIPTTRKIIRDVEMKEMRYSPNDKVYLVHCTRTIHVFDTDDRKLFQIKSLLPVDGNLTFDQVLFSDDDDVLVTVQGVHICVWSNEGKLLRILVNTNQQQINHGIIKHKHLFSLDSAHRISKWDLSRVKNGTKPKMNIHTGSVDKMVTLNQNTVACYGDDTPEITIFCSDTGRTIRTLVPRHDEGCVIVHVLSSKNGEYLITVQANAEPIFPTSEINCDATLWQLSTGQVLLNCDGCEYAGFSPKTEVAFFIRFSPEVGRDCLVYDIQRSQQRTLPLPPMAIQAKPVVDSRFNLRFFTTDLDAMDLLLWKISLEEAQDYKSVYFTETHSVTDIRPTENDDIVNILHTGGLITYDLSMHQIMRKVSFPSSPQTIYNSQCTMALDGRRLHDLNHSCNEKIMRMRAAPNLVIFILKENFLAYISEECDRLIIKGVRDGKRRAWCDLHGRGTSIAASKDDRTVLVGCEDGRILALTLMLDKKDIRDIRDTIPSRSEGRPKTAKQVLKDDLDRAILNSASTGTVFAKTRLKPRPGSSVPRPFGNARMRPMSSPAIRLADRPYTR